MTMSETGRKNRNVKYAIDSVPSDCGSVSPAPVRGLRPIHLGEGGGEAFTQGCQSPFGQVSLQQSPLG